MSEAWGKFFCVCCGGVERDLADKRLVAGRYVRCVYCVAKKGRPSIVKNTVPHEDWDASAYETTVPAHVLDAYREAYSE